MSDIKLKKLELRVKELEARVEALEHMEEILVFQPPGEDYHIEFTPDPEFLKGLEMLRNNLDSPVADRGSPSKYKDGSKSKFKDGPNATEGSKDGPNAAEGGEVGYDMPLTTAEIHHFPGLCDADSWEDDGGK